MRTIYKYQIGVIKDSFSLVMPKDAKVLVTNIQRGELCLWAEVDSSADMQSRDFCVFGTGHKIPEDKNLVFINTFFVDGGTYVFHMYEEI